YHSKYTKGETQYIIPARIPREKYLYAQEIGLKAFRSLGCSGGARVDLMTDEEGKPFVIDVNTMPGMTETSLLPQAAAFAGIAFEELVERILLGAARTIEGGMSRMERRSGGNHTSSPSVNHRGEDKGTKPSQESFKWKTDSRRRRVDRGIWKVDGSR
ncbi:MAG: D-alanine--D-alanine ligase, partial [Deltaproteobacteria bacterium]|nr:D-alanine--D-alanine ligase [Deltaproteobacteria bacterium]